MMRPAFETSAGTSDEKRRCIFCWRLAQNLLGKIASWIKPTKSSTGQAPDIPVYRWSLRKAAKIDETEDCFVLTFTAVLIDETMAGWYRNRDEVPDTAFYVLREQGYSACLLTRMFLPLLIHFRPRSEA